MISTVQSITPLPDVHTDVAAPAIEPTARTAADPSKDAPANKADDQKAAPGIDRAPDNPLAIEPDFRLVIEHNVERSVLVYKLINRVTGELLYEISRDDVVKFISDPSYRAGGMIDTKA